MLRQFSAMLARKRPPACVPPGRRIYAIGDIHGRIDLLGDLLARIDADHAERSEMPRTLVFLGDLIDRGPASAAVVARLMDLSRQEESIHFLLGNHEEMLLKSIGGDAGVLRMFLRVGGVDTVLSYGVDPGRYQEAGYDEVLAMMREQVPQAHLDFLAAFEDMVILGDYAFVHAGIKPQVPLSEQKPETLRWIRQGFVDWPGRFEKVIVHGHTITKDVDDTGHRIGIDTGAYESGRLTAMGFEDDQRWVLQTAGP